MACLKEETEKKLIYDNDCTWLEYNLQWNVGRLAQASWQRLGPKVVEGLRCGVCRSVNELCIYIK